MFSRIKEFIIELCKTRLFVLIAVFAFMFFVIAQRLFSLQIVDGEKYLEDYTLQIKKTKEELELTRKRVLELEKINEAYRRASQTAVYSDYAPKDSTLMKENNEYGII